MACVPETICTHLTLGTLDVCPYGKESSCSTTVENDNARRRHHRAGNELAAAAAEQRRRWGYSPELMLCDDPWKITKKLTQSDLGYLSRLLISKDLAEDLVLPVLTPEQRVALYQNGTQILIWDMDTQSLHYLVFKFWVSSRSYVFIDNWTKDFVKRRGLKKGDEIKLHWDPYKKCFDFSVLYSN
ncbi:putative B3 domain-containing protein At1g78640 [Lotus japonicus]|uniref:putative B3 domain-containing protein At1g78640 n=1 Tax=Lotus japonicus TaxID=34305 RepID=UPI00258C6A2F|nr:putative B3 domain-containing protein At1g78640 [Lotus japonicus]